MREWPWTGRGPELRRIRRELTRDPPGAVMVSGAGGVGKTRLAREAVSGLNVPVFWVGGTGSTQQIPLGAFAPWIDDAIVDPLRRITALLGTLSAAPAQVVVVDDVDHLDEQSLFVVHRLLAIPAVGLLITTRGDAAASTRTADLLRDGTIVDLELAPLGRADVSALMRWRLGAPIAVPLAQQLWTMTRGNPFFLVTVCDTNLDTGRMVLREGRWTADGPPELPGTLAGVLDARLRAVGDGVADVVNLVALAEPLELGVLSDLCAPTDVEAAETAGFIAIESIDAYGRGAVDTAHVTLTHPLYGEARMATVSRVRLNRLRTNLIQRLAADPAVDAQSRVQRGLLALDATRSLPQRAPLLLDGAEAALHLLHLPLARDLSAAAVEGSCGLPALILHAYTLSLSGLGTEAETLLSTTLADVDHEIDQDVRDTIGFIRAATQFWCLDDADGAREVIDASGVSLPVRQLWDCLIAAIAGCPADAMALADHSEPADPSKPLPTIFGIWGAIAALADTGRVTDMNEVAKSGYQIADTFPAAAYHRAELSYMHAFFCALCGDLDTIDGLTAELMTVTEDVGGIAVFWAWGVRGLAAVAHGDAADAAATLDATLDEMRSAQAAQFMRRPFEVERAQAAALAGDAETLTTLLADLPNPPTGALGYARTRISLLHAWSSAIGGSLSAAIDAAHRAAECARERGQRVNELLALHTAVRWGDTTGLDRLGELSELLTEVPRARSAATHVRALATHDGELLHAVAREYLGLGMADHAVDALAHAAIVFRNSGHTGKRLSAVEQMTARADACGLHTPATAAALDTVPFSPRQREIVTLARRGLSNQEIAQQLSLSTRTVEGHLYRAGLVLGSPVRPGHH
ncbi:helix-turn-helix transcriptional regulator [Gordonia sp. DT30]|uniref:helix-turn-helix transcriptional regulator n=1 Tax=Gordonia sp. DT30 TaxID=3416546 RepID=UPI003CE7E184